MTLKEAWNTLCVRDRREVADRSSIALAKQRILDVLQQPQFTAKWTKLGDEGSSLTAPELVEQLARVTTELANDDKHVVNMLLKRLTWRIRDALEEKRREADRLKRAAKEPEKLGQRADSPILPVPDSYDGCRRGFDLPVAVEDVIRITRDRLPDDGHDALRLFDETTNFCLAIRHAEMTRAEVYQRVAAGEPTGRLSIERAKSRFNTRTSRLVDRCVAVVKRKRDAYLHALGGPPAPPPRTLNADEASFVLLDERNGIVSLYLERLQKKRVARIAAMCGLFGRGREA